MDDTPRPRTNDLPLFPPHALPRTRTLQPDYECLLARCALQQVSTSL